MVGVIDAPSASRLEQLDCAFRSPVYVKVSWLAWSEYGTHVTGQCVAETPSN